MQNPSVSFSFAPGKNSHRYSFSQWIPGQNLPVFEAATDKMAGSMSLGRSSRDSSEHELFVVVRSCSMLQLPKHND